MIEVVSLVKSFGSNRVLRGIDLSVADGETLTILGRSGSGKTVLLKHIVGLLKPDEGYVVVDGLNISRAKRSEIFRARKNMGFVFQSSALFDSMTVYDNVALPLLEQKLPGDEIDRRVKEALRRVEMEGTEEVYPAELSGGMKKRVGIARAVVSAPGYIFYDEPTTGLDPVTADTICDLIKALDEELGVTSVVVTHDMHLATKVSDRIVLLSEGKVAWRGTPREAASSEDKAISRFLEATGAVV